MNTDPAIRGSLFATDFLNDPESLGELSAWNDLTDEALHRAETRLRELDALYLHLYGITERDDVRYIYSTFPIVERQEAAAYGAFRSRDLCLAWMNALAAGQPDAEVDV